MPSVSLDQLIETARRLKSTLVAFWVDEASAYAWAVPPDGTVVGHRAPVTSREIERLVRQTWESTNGSAREPRTRGLVTRGGAR